MPRRGPRKRFSVRLDAGEIATTQELAEAVGLAERHVSRQLRLAYLATEEDTAVEEKPPAGKEHLAQRREFKIRDENA